MLPSSMVNLYFTPFVITSLLTSFRVQQLAFHNPLPITPTTPLPPIAIAHFDLLFLGMHVCAAPIFLRAYSRTPMHHGIC